jgi:DNA helicase-2/ATP-dependent DNA helicase PcrA
MTRARERLYLLHAMRRFNQGMFRNNIPSRFLADIPSGDRAQPAGTRHSGSTLTPRERRAALAARDAHGDEPPQEPQFSSGDRVRHGHFGRGIVVSCVLRGGDQEVTVAFEGGAGIKKLLLSLAPLQLE